VNQTFYKGFFGQGSLFVDFPTSSLFQPGNNCTAGHFSWVESGPVIDSVQFGLWHPGNCEADYICRVPERAQAQPCSEGFVCSEKTTSVTAQATQCQGGFVCDYGSTPDIDLLSPNGKYKKLCPAKYVCGDGTGTSQMLRILCPLGYFCPTGTSDALLGKVAGDAFFRGFTAEEANPFTYNDPPDFLLPPHVRLPRRISKHDLLCFQGINATNIATPVVVTDEIGRKFSTTAALVSDRRCARDHKWSLTKAAVDRLECFCEDQAKLALHMYKFWRCSFHDHLCSFPATEGGTTWTRSILSGGVVNTPVQFPDPADNSSLARYSVTCVPPVVSCTQPRLFSLNDDVQCPAFCSFLELKTWIESRWVSEMQRTEVPKLQRLDARIRPLIYDMKYAMDLLDNSVTIEDGLPPSDDDPYYLGAELPNIIRVINGTVERLDLCQCEQTLRCPNGTTTLSIGAQSISECVRTSSEVSCIASLFTAAAVCARSSSSFNF
jgi:hypothetical protein